MEAFALYVYPLDGGPYAKTFHEGAEPIAERVQQAVESGKYKEIRVTDMLDRLVLHMRACPETIFSNPWERLYP
tara:strand:+ start:815 stop:1036 length:222 start_codon:yes stop_codon:yes gene_type:complete